MSYINAADAAAIRAPLPANSTRTSSPWTFNLTLPVGSALEVVLLLATSGAVSFVLCTMVAGALLD